MDNNIVGNRIKKIRINMGLTMEEFGKLVGASKNSVSQWENGRNAPSLEKVQKICELANILPSHLLDLDDLSAYPRLEKNQQSIVDIFKAFSEGKISGISISDEKTGLDYVLNLEAFRANPENYFKGFLNILLMAEGDFSKIRTIPKNDKQQPTIEHQGGKETK